MRGLWTNILKSGWKVGNPGFPRRSVLLPALTLLGILLASKAIAARATYRDDPTYLIDTWEMEDGLPENSATAMVQTPDGYLWFGTFNGLVRFDGMKFTVFNSANTPELPSGSIVSLHLDRRGWLWVGTYRGLALLEGTRWRAVGTNEWSKGIVRTFTERANGDLLITRFDGSVFEFAGARLVELPAPPGKQGAAYLGHADEAGQWWVVQDQLIARWDGQRWVETLSVSKFASSVIGAGTGHDGVLWLLLEKELRKYRAGAEVARLPLPESTGGCWSITEDSRGNVWIASFDSGLSCVSPSGKMRRWTTTNGLSSNATRFVFEDRECNLWVGTSAGGLQRFKQRRVQSFGLENGLTDRNLTSVTPDGTGGMWLATYGHGMFHWSDGVVTNVSLPPGRKTIKQINSVLNDKAGRTWFGTGEDGVCVIDSRGFRQIPPEQTGGLYVYSLFEDSHSRIWAGGDECISVGEDNTFRPLQDETGKSIGGIRCFAEDREGIVWLSNLDDVFRYDKERFVKIRGGGASLRDIGCIKADADGTVWLGAHGGALFCWRAGRVMRITLGVDGLAPDVYGLLEDNAGYFWMASDHGVLRAARKDLLAAADGSASHIECQVLDQGDGLPSMDCSSGHQPVCARDALGRLWFATTKGAAMIDPAEFRLNTNFPPVQIEEVSYLLPRSATGIEREVEIRPPFPQKMLLPPGSRRLEILYAGLSFVTAEKVRFQTKLEPADTDWQRVGGQRVADYYGLQPADYVFRVRAANNDGIWNESGAALAFTVLPLFWQTAWFRTLEWSAALVEGMLILGLLRALARRRLAKLALRERLRFEQLVSELSSMFINLPIEMMDAKITEGLGRVAQRLDFDVASLAMFKGRVTEERVAFRWRAEGVEQILPDLSEEDFPWSVKELFQGHEVCLPSLQKLPPEAGVDQATYQRSGVRSAYQIPLSAEGAPLASLSLCTVGRERALPAELLQRQRMVGEVFANALTRKFTENRRRESEARFRESEERMSLAAEAANLGMWMWDIPANTIWATEKFRRLFGFGLDEKIHVEGIQGRVHPEDRGAREKALRRALEGGYNYDVEYRLLLAGGTQLWMASHGRAELDSEGQPVRMLGVCIDITDRHRTEEEAREVSGRLITAQEDERTRLARELHDDLSQSLALLSVDLDLFGQQQPQEMGDSARGRIEELAIQVRNLSSEVHRLSHELHPAKLEQLGLTAALRSFCKDVAAAHKIAVEFEARDVPRAMPDAVALCLYRIAQEAVQNVVKHSGATHAQVELVGSTNAIKLTISDDGTGFDLEKIRGNGSLGLVSMRERVRVVHGQLSLDSTKGQGTRVEAQVPV
jgi:PAS domain S-box-containing protein